MAQKVWFQLVDARGTKLVYFGSVRPTETDDLDDFTREVKAKCGTLLANTPAALLSVFESINDTAPLLKSLPIGNRGRDGEAPLLVRVPDSSLVGLPSTAFISRCDSKRQRVDDLTASLPRAQALPNETTISDESVSLDLWSIGEVHDIPAIWEFFHDLGGCTQKGKLLWRQEDRDVASLVLGGWSGLPGMERIVDKKSILEGSPGTGKSTLLCLLALHAVFKLKKSVFVYRQVTHDGKTINYLIYVGFDNDRVVYFKKKNCEHGDVKKIYDALIEQHTKANFWLFLDGFEYLGIPQGLGCFRMLATSQQVDLKSQESVHAYCMLHPSWKKNDLVQLGEQVYGWDDAEVDERFYYSGGSVREFVQFALEDIVRSVSWTRDHQPRRLLHLFVVESCESVTGGPAPLLDRYLGHSEQLIDSQYALLLLSDRLCVATVEEMLLRARARGSSYAALTGLLFKILVNSLALQSNLTIFVAPSDQDMGFLTQPMRPPTFAKLAVQRGSTRRCSSHKTWKDDLREWRDNDKLWYWYPEDHELYPFDAVIKLADGLPPTEAAVDGDDLATPRKQVRVAYLQMAVCNTRGIDTEELDEVNAIFVPKASEESAGDSQATKPVYVLLCPSLSDAQNAMQERRRFLSAAEEVCDVRVGYYDNCMFPVSRVPWRSSYSFW